MSETSGTRRRSWLIRLLLVFLGSVLIWRGVDLLVAATIAPGYSRPGHVVRALTSSALVVLLLVGVLAWERRKAADYGLVPTRSGLASAGLGALGYLAPWGLASSIILAAGWAELRAPDGFGVAVAQTLAVLVLVLLYEAIPEELIFRGYLYSTLRERLPRWASVLGQSALFCAFGALIGAAVTVERQLLFAFFSLSLGLLRAVSGSVFTTIGFHAAFQTVSQLLVGSSWTAYELVDPDRWYTDIAVALAPLVLGPIAILGWLRWRARTHPKTADSPDRHRIR